MDNAINGRTPEEIKARIDYCRNAKTAEDCMSCPYGEDADVCASDFMFDAFDYMQQLERERDELLQKNQQLERERDAAVAEFTEFANSVAICVFCKDFKFDEPCDKGINGEDCWQWRGVQEVNENGKESS